ncbi:MAG: DnaJ domain-containing protein [Chloroflexi bacterium]|nr:DnaJ domain-containing protein [Chloroflexota bacterium]
MSLPDDYYARLGLSPRASLEDIHQAYRKIARRFHPDVNPSPGATAEFQRLIEAYEVLGDPARRKAYDAWLLPAAPEALLAMQLTPARSSLLALDEPQISYALLEVTASVPPDLPEPALNLSLVLDRSTSMRGERLDQVKDAAAAILRGMDERDTISVVAFSDRAQVVAPAQRGGDRALAIARVSTLNASGGTEILQGLVYGLAELHQHLSPALVNYLLLLTDGRTYGDEADCLNLAALAVQDGITIGGLGLGHEWNDDFLDRLTGITGGRAAFLESPRAANSFMREMVRKLGQVFAQRVELTVTPDPGVQLQEAYLLSPEAAPLPDRQPLPLGNLIRSRPLLALLQFLAPPVTARKLYTVARLTLSAEPVGPDRPRQQLVRDFALPVLQDAPPEAPPALILEALSRISLARLAENARATAARGKTGLASRRLETLATHLLQSGQRELAEVALQEARRVEDGGELSPAGQKRLRYGTRMLMQLPSPKEPAP